MQTLSLVYAEIASNRMRKTRGKVLHNRDFLAAIREIFEEVHAAYTQKIATSLRKRFLPNDRITLLSHNGKTVGVFLSANTGLYGDIVNNTFEKFLADVMANPEMEVTLIGKLGLSLFQSAVPGRPYTYFELPDTQVGQQDLGLIIRHIVQYEKIIIYYGKFESVIAQKPATFEISANSPLGIQTTAKPSVQYIFEPSIEKILMFFESEIFASLFHQSVRESELAKFASRILAMDRASENMKEYLKKIEIDVLRSKHRSGNKRQLNSFPYQLFTR